MNGSPTVPLLVLSALSSLVDVDLQKIDPRSFEVCEQLVRDHPGAPGAHKCFNMVGDRLRRMDEAARRLEGLLEKGSGNDWTRHWLSVTYSFLGDSAKAEQLMRQAIEGFAASGDPRGVVWSRGTLSFQLRRAGRAKEARPQVDAALDVAKGSGDEQLVASALIEAAWQDRAEQDYRSAWKRLMEAEGILFPNGTWFQQQRVLEALAGVAYDLRRYVDAWTYYGRQREIIKGLSPGTDADVLRNMGLVADRLSHEGLITEEDVIQVKREAVEAAVRAGNRWAEIGARLQLASHVERSEAIDHARRALALARELGSSDLHWALWVLGEGTHSLGPEHHEEARGYFDEAIALARERGDGRKMVQGLVVRSTAALMEAGHDRAVAESLEALEAIEKRRDLQLDGEVRSRVFAAHAHVYRRFAAWLLEANGTIPPDEDIALAFLVLERMRARELLDMLDAARGSGVHASGGPLGEQRDGVLKEIAGLQRRLLKPELPQAERALVLQQLEVLERREADLRAEMARGHPAFAAIRRPVLATLPEVQEALAANEAMVVFGDGETYRRGSKRYETVHAILVTRERIDVATALKHSALLEETDLFLSLLDRRDGSDLEGASRLYEDLIQRIVSLLPSDVERLIIIPDGALNRVPFDALLDPATADPLAVPYEISLVPSATVWLGWRRLAAERPARTLLAFADPALLAQAEAASTRGAMFDEAVRLGPLPHARLEARAMLGQIGGDGQILTGDQATEAAFKQADLRSFRMLHLAAHALVDFENPERSAIVLAPGAPGEDGLLQLREILGLDLDGQFVLLTACRSAAGPIIGGEIPMGLAAAFFQAGARAVIAGLWPLNDRETAVLVEELARHLGRGASVGTALARARRSMIRDRAPAAAWSGLVLVGDADLVPFPEGAGGWSNTSQLLALLAAAVLVAGAAITGFVIRMQRSRARA